MTAVYGTSTSGSSGGVGVGGITDSANWEEVGPVVAYLMDRCISQGWWWLACVTIGSIYYQIVEWK